MENVIEFLFRQENVTRDVVLDEGEISVASEVPDVLEIARDQIINRNHPVSLRQQPIGQMRPQKTSTARDDRDFLRTRSHVWVFLIRQVRLGQRFVISPIPAKNVSQWLTSTR